MASHQFLEAEKKEVIKNYAGCLKLDSYVNKKRQILILFRMLHVLLREITAMLTAFVLKTKTIATTIKTYKIQKT